MKKAKFIVAILSILLVSILTFFWCRQSASSSNQYIIDPKDIAAISFSDQEEATFREVAKEDIQSLIKVLNTAEYDEDINDGRLIKMKAPFLIIHIQYKNGTDVTVQVWDNLLTVNHRWYQLDIRKIKNILY